MRIRKIHTQADLPNKLLLEKRGDSARSTFVIDVSSVFGNDRLAKLRPSVPYDAQKKFV